MLPKKLQTPLAIIWLKYQKHQNILLNKNSTPFVEKAKIVTVQSLWDTPLALQGTSEDVKPSQSLVNFRKLAENTLQDQLCAKLSNTLNIDTVCTL